MDTKFDETKTTHNQIICRNIYLFRFVSQQISIYEVSAGAWLPTLALLQPTLTKSETERQCVWRFSSSSSTNENLPQLNLIISLELLYRFFSAGNICWWMLLVKNILAAFRRIFRRTKQWNNASDRCLPLITVRNWRLMMTTRERYLVRGSHCYGNNNSNHTKILTFQY